MEGGLDWILYRILDLSWIKRWKYSADWGGREGKTKKIEQVAKSKDSLVYWHDPGIYCIIIVYIAIYWHDDPGPGPGYLNIKNFVSVSSRE